MRLLADEESRDLILDDEALLHALLERGGCCRVSSHFYFYVLVRNVFRRADIGDRTVADYVAEVLGRNLPVLSKVVACHPGASRTCWTIF